MSWFNSLNLANCDLNSSIASWLGVEKESLSVECNYKFETPKTKQNIDNNYTTSLKKKKL